MLKFSCVVSVLLLFFFGASGQGYTTLKNASKKSLTSYNEATKYLMQDNLLDAQKVLEKLTTDDPRFIDAWLLLGELYKENKDFERGKSALEKVIAIDPEYSSKGYFFLAECDWNLDRYEDCITSIEKYLSFTDITKQRKIEAERMFMNSKFASVAIQHPVPFEPKNLGDAINTDLMEYLPSLTGDEETIVFTRRVGSGRNANEDFYVSQRNNDQWNPSKPLDGVNSYYNEGAQTITPDGKTMYYVVCDKPGGFGGCDIYFTKQSGQKWSEPKNVGSPVCTNAWETQPCISADGKSLYFVSTRAGGKGGSDIWVATQDKSGKWTTPVNLGDSINTGLDEKSPFIHPDGRTIYFSSNGRPGMGRDDIYYSRKKADGTWSTPVNIGYPINTKNDENSFIVSLDGKHGYFSSDRFKENRDMDLYEFDLYKEARPQTVTYVKGVVTDAASGIAVMATIEFIDLESGTYFVQGISDVTDGSYLTSLPAGKNYALNVSAKGYLFYSENFSLIDYARQEPFLINIALKPMEVGSNMVLKNIFFETDSYALKEESRVELNKLLELLKQNPLLKIQIGGHTDNQGSSDYNQQLSENRAKAVFDLPGGQGHYCVTSLL
jgi:flagellar motor protein MotB